MDPKFLAKAKARTAGVKGPPPLPAVDQERPTPRPPALAPERPTPHPAAPDELPPPTPRAPALPPVDVAPLTPRPVPVAAESLDDEDEHTVMRPAAAPLPRDAFRDDGAAHPLAAEGEPGVGLPLELSVPEANTRKSRAGIAWLLLGALAVGAGAQVLVKQRDAGSAVANGAAPAPKSFIRPPPAPTPGRPRDDGALEPPISTSAEANEALPEEEVINTPTGVRRRPRPAAAKPAQAPLPPAAAAAATPEPGVTPPPAAAAPASNEALPAPEPTTTAQPAPSAEGAAGAAATTPPAAPAAGTKPGAAAAPADPEPSTAPSDELPQGSVDHYNPYGE